MGQHSATIRLAANRAALPTLGDRVSQFADEAELWPALYQRLALVCDELAANVVSHGSRSPHPATFISIRIAQIQDRLALTIEDDGEAFDPLSLEAPDLEASLDQREIGGLGIYLIRKMAQGMRYERADGVNRLHLTLSVNR
jgi:serine/threonine-protein kinase RsbW